MIPFIIASELRCPKCHAFTVKCYTADSILHFKCDRNPRVCEFETKKLLQEVVQDA